MLRYTVYLHKKLLVCTRGAACFGLRLEMAVAVLFIVVTVGASGATALVGGAAAVVIDAATAAAIAAATAVLVSAVHVEWKLLLWRGFRVRV